MCYKSTLPPLFVLVITSHASSASRPVPVAHKNCSTKSSDPHSPYAIRNTQYEPPTMLTNHQPMIIIQRYSPAQLESRTLVVTLRERQLTNDLQKLFYKIISSPLGGIFKGVRTRQV